MPWVITDEEYDMLLDRANKYYDKDKKSKQFEGLMMVLSRMVRMED